MLPAFAFMTFCSLRVIPFACLYRIIDLDVPGDHLNFNGTPYQVGFSEIMRFVHDRQVGSEDSANVGLGRRLDREEEGVEHRDQQQG